MNNNNSAAFQRLAIQKQNLLSELITSESKYLNYLNRIVQFFETPLQQRGLLPKDVLRDIFGRIKPLLVLSNSLLESFLTMDIGESIIQLAPFFKVYSDYARNHYQAIAKLESWKNRSEMFHRFIEQQENSMEVNMKLPALLIMPVQRLPRYELLLRDICLISLQLDGFAQTDCRCAIDAVMGSCEKLNGCPDDAAFEKQFYHEMSAVDSLGALSIQNLSSATIKFLRSLVAVVCITTYLNEQVQAGERTTIALMIQSKFPNAKDQGILLAPGRELIKYGMLKKVNNSNGMVESRLFVLMTDILIYAKPTVLKLRPKKASLDLSTFSLQSSGACVNASLWSRLKSSVEGMLSPDRCARRPGAQKRNTWRPSSAVFASNDFGPGHSLSRNSSFTTARSDELIDGIPNHVTFAVSATLPLHKCALIDLKDDRASTRFSFTPSSRSPLSPQPRRDSIASISSRIGHLSTHTQSPVSSSHMILVSLSVDRFFIDPRVHF